MDSDTHNNNITERQRNRNKTNIALFTIAGVLLLAIIIIFFAASGDSDYEKGNKYLSEKNYDEAIYYYQKVSPDDKEFKMAQSKINYAKGIQAFNSGRTDEARLYLSKVDPADEYYETSRLIIDKLSGTAMSDVNKNAPGPDTIILKERKPVVIDERDKKKTDTVKVRDNDQTINKKYINSVNGNISGFQSLYQSAYSAPVTEKSNIIKNMRTAASKFDGLPYIVSNKDQNVLELKRMVKMWMDKRIEFINRLIAENSVNESNTTRSLKEEGDKLYNMVQNQLTIAKRLYGI